MELVVNLFKRIQFALDEHQIGGFYLKPKQVACFEEIYTGNDVLAVLPTGFGKSLLYHLLSSLIPIKKNRNITIVVSPLNSIIEDQSKVLTERGISVGILQCERQKQKIEKLFPDNKDKEELSKVTTTSVISDKIQNGEIDILFSHPESLLSSEGRKLLKSDVYQDNVVACVIDEVHCVQMWGKEFRTDFMDLAALRAFFPSRPILALTATALKSLIKSIKKDLCIENSRVIIASPNRTNIFLNLQKRMPDNYGIKSYDAILRPIAQELDAKREEYPMTIIYMGLKYCGYAFELFNIVLKNQYVGREYNPVSRLFTQFHAPTDNCLKEDILCEIKKSNSRIRVIFATTALGMGVDAPNITRILHITPPANLESYIQEIGRAGRTGKQSYATLFFNNSDIGGNRDTICPEMKKYCKESGCLRVFLLKYFNFSCKKQELCCSNCDVDVKLQIPALAHAPIKIRPALINGAEDLIRVDLENLATNEESDVDYLFFTCSLLPAVIEKIIANVEYIVDDSDLLHNFSIWEERLAHKVLCIIEVYAPKFNY